MELTKSFPPADALIETLQEIDYQKLGKNVLGFVITFVATVAVIATFVWNFVKVLKFSTPHSISEFFYFGVNFIGESGDEIVGLSVGNRYVGIYNNGIAWGILNENGAL